MRDKERTKYEPVNLKAFQKKVSAIIYDLMCIICFLI
jgi:hypothetical protein